ncbi:MAG: DNA-3-methyladenine glycosylase family protein [Candidatus Geothermarchaeales archaeon]
MSSVGATELRNTYETVLRGLAPYSFELTVHKPAGWHWLTPFEVFEEGTIWSGWRIDGRPIGLKLSSAGGVDRPKIHMKAYSEEMLSPEDRRKVRVHMSKGLGLKEDIRGFYRLARDHPLLSKAVEDLYGMRWGQTGTVFSGALLAVTLQMAPVRRSLEMHRSLYLNYGQNLRFDGHEITIHPSPEMIHKTTEEELRSRCTLGYRARYLKSIARDVVMGTAPTMKELERMTPQDAKEELTKLTGIGEYSAGIISRHPSFPLDVWSVRIFAKVFGLKLSERPRDEIPRVKRRAREAFGEWRHYAFLYVLHDLENLGLEQQ